MKKLFKPFALLFASAALLSACSSDEPAGNSVPENVKGMDAYLRVNIQAVGDMIGKAATDPWETTDPKDGEYQYGSEAENKVNNVKFYFYAPNKTFMQEGTLTKFNSSTGTNENVEVFGQNVLVLKGLTNNTTPRYLLTVINPPQGFKPGATLDDTRNALVSAVQSDYNETKGFVMSTSSYVETATPADAGYTYEYGTNLLSKSDFLVQPAGTTTPDNVTFTDEEVVDIYVERLAAKVQVEVNLSSTENTLVKDGVGNTYVAINVPVAGDPNELDESEALKTVYVKLSSWGLNATTKQSYMTKNIKDMTADDINKDAAWKFVWNNPGYHRSYWGHSVVWGQNLTGGENGNANFITLAQANKPFVLDATNNKFNYDYCFENTNTLDKIASANLTKTGNLTHVIFSAGVYEKKDGAYLPLDMVRFNGSLYRTSWFKKFALNNLNLNGKLNYYKKVSDNHYIQMDATDLKLALKSVEGNGMVKIVSGVTAADNYFVKGEGDTYTEFNFTEDTKDGEGNVTAKGTITLLNEALANFDNSGKTIANAFNGGAMQYAIPIEHLVKTRGTSNAIVEGNYGIVRNHWYVLTVNKLVRLGTGVFDPEEVIVTPVEPEDPTYYMGARINILSWKIVTQKVEL